MRKIIHIDMDYFYAQVEERDDPSLKVHPVAIGGPTKKQGVLCTANYKAREYGVRGGQSTYEAFKRCPQMLLIYPQFEKYKAISEQFLSVYQDYTDLIQKVGLDEVYLDVSESKACSGSAIKIAEEIKSRIFEGTGLTCSAGISVNKMLAKIASDWRKPNGIFAVLPSERESFMHTLPLKRIPGVGIVTLDKLKQAGFETAGDVVRSDISRLNLLMGEKKSIKLFQHCQGVCRDEVITHRPRKTVSYEKTYFSGLPYHALPKEVENVVQGLSLKLLELENFHFDDRSIVGLTLKVRNTDFRTFTRSVPLSPIESESLKRSKVISSQQTESLLAALSEFSSITIIRLLGVGVRFSDDKSQQIEMLI
ncbi:putative DNA polymerase IV [Vibrio nigripulchritudo SFn27]|uniref:DNA polymerase IV n=1 Tax=Vibrio nigripulchritudo TaxID=28173 RepID=A0A9P1NJP2_9VIBR|nr:DNA polymerase IV [Vibrio nigripulchritudo]CBJ93093.1 Putative DNA polymerase IV (Pol IV) [Vibrio nigripulchritudo]CCN85909.1 putative DNA polymerase IV [Vibrio nigripulchritudo BLFn1]CCN91900.1 putative DNA polymerase IV [Vibrio nigripulchritudo SFn27]CCN97706.1 putative DNA polymerase IV [Vibrio nigripulchritudo ENn2]CCO43937.1 putative DNA polymerase IV [Vibrio nigripulchritudo SFn135]